METKRAEENTRKTREAIDEILAEASENEGGLFAVTPHDIAVFNANAFAEKISNIPPKAPFGGKKVNWR